MQQKVLWMTAWEREECNTAFKNVKYLFCITTNLDQLCTLAQFSGAGSEGTSP